MYNSLIQPHFDHGCICTLYFTRKEEKNRNKNKCICICLELISRQRIGRKEFKDINCLALKENVEEHVPQIFLVTGRRLHYSM